MTPDQLCHQASSLACINEATR